MYEIVPTLHSFSMDYHAGKVKSA